MAINHNNIPAHVAIIMDGNGRWAKKRGLPKIMGHRQGIKSVEKIMNACKEFGVKILTLYVFSTENWKRPKKEINSLMNLLESYLTKFAPKLKKEDVRLNIIGNPLRLPGGVRKSLKDAIELTKRNSSFILNLAINYGGRSEILEATKSISRKYKTGSLDIEKFYSILISFNITACGYGAIATVMEISKRMGATKGKLLKYATSGDIVGDNKSVVGYSSILFV